MAPIAERNALEREPIGTSKLITPVADCRWYDSSKIVSYGSQSVTVVMICRIETELEIIFGFILKAQY